MTKDTTQRVNRLIRVILVWSLVLNTSFIYIILLTIQIKNLIIKMVLCLNYIVFLKEHTIYKKKKSAKSVALINAHLLIDEVELKLKIGKIRKYKILNIQ